MNSSQGEGVFGNISGGWPGLHLGVCRNQEGESAKKALLQANCTIRSTLFWEGQNEEACLRHLIRLKETGPNLRLESFAWIPPAGLHNLTIGEGAFEKIRGKESKNRRWRSRKNGTKTRVGGSRPGQEGRKKAPAGPKKGETGKSRGKRQAPNDGPEGKTRIRVRTAGQGQKKLHGLMRRRPSRQ